MIKQKFFDLANLRFGRCELVLHEKDEEYAKGRDKLHNFKRAADLTNCSPEEALVGMLSKHLISILDMVEDLPVIPPRARLEEKITDAINYLVLLEALFVERFDEDKPNKSWWEPIKENVCSGCPVDRDCKTCSLGPSVIKKSEVPF